MCVDWVISQVAFLRLCKQGTERSQHGSMVWGSMRAKIGWQAVRLFWPNVLLIVTCVGCTSVSLNHDMSHSN